MARRIEQRVDADPAERMGARLQDGQTAVDNDDAARRAGTGAARSRRRELDGEHRRRRRRAFRNGTNGPRAKLGFDSDGDDRIREMRGTIAFDAL